MAEPQYRAYNGVRNRPPNADHFETMAPVNTTRAAIYQLVWSKPMSSVAKDFGISDVALKKICVKHRIPSPSRGYWAKKEAGKPVKQPRLVETADPLDERVAIGDNSQAELPEAVRKVLQEARAARTPRPQVPITGHQLIVIPLQRIHAAIAPTAKRLRTQKPDKDGVVSAAVSGCCGIEISAIHAERCIAVLDALARTLAIQNIDLTPTGAAMAVTASGAKVKFRLLEYVERKKTRPDAGRTGS